MDVRKARRLLQSNKDLSDYTVTIASIVFMQRDDYNEMERKLNESSDPDTCVWLSDRKVQDYLIQWYDGDDSCYQQDTYSLEDINTPFLGNLIAINRQAWLYSLNTRIGYAGLSKIIAINRKG